VLHNITPDEVDGDDTDGKYTHKTHTCMHDYTLKILYRTVGRKRALHSLAKIVPSLSMMLIVAEEGVPISSPEYTPPGLSSKLDTVTVKEWLPSRASSSMMVTFAHAVAPLTEDTAGKVMLSGSVAL